MKAVRIGRIIPILKKEIEGFHMPIVSEIALRKDPFTVLISCILSLRTKDETTAAASKRLFREAPTAKKLAAVPVKRIERLIYPVGFYKTKARRIRDIAQVLIDQYDSRVPNTIDELLKLHGVGRKTANIVVTIGFNKPGVAVDTHVHRISNRLGYVKTKTPEQTEFALRAKLPKKYWMVYNDLLVTWGQNICRPISPLCSRCAIREHCSRVGVGVSR
ncbi:endonuclease III [Candidatus Woesearchaeota archaeon]|nr:endonuclease III [Candidatus Woesearchaeota archaeon]